jgi:uncharacterized membrane protein YccF (DUF307 family)
MDMLRPNRTVSWAIVAGLWLALVTAEPARAAVITITVTNTASRDVTGLYLAATAQSAWGSDRLNGDFLTPNQSVTLSGVSCTGSIVVVAEDVAGCFAYQSVACGGDVSWTITNTTPRDCGR